MSELLVLGGGPAGLGVAFYARRAGRRVALYEKASEPGGMCRTFRCGEHRYDAGAHRFHDRDPEVTADLRALLGEELRAVDAPSQVWTRGRFVDFPPTPLNAALSYGLGGAARIGLELLRARRPRAGGEVSFEDFARGRFGATLARELLLDYSEKLWGLPAARLSPDVATRRLHGMTLRSLLVELLRPGRRSAHIDGQFLYPRLGYGALAASLAASLPREALRTGCEVAGVDADSGVVVRLRFSDGSTAAVPRGARVVSTLPVTRLAALLGGAVAAPAREAAARLLFRQIRLVFLRLDQPRVSPNASIYLPDPKLCVSRVSEPKNRSAAMAPAHETSLVAEVPCFAGDELDALDDAALAERVVAELEGVGLARRERVLERRCHRLPDAYPVYSVGFEADLRVVLDGLKAVHNLDTLGRAGAFRYSHLHDQLRFAKDYVASLAP